MSNSDKNPVITEVVLEMEGRGLFSGKLEDFILSPNRGSEYIYEGRLYEVVQAIETIGDATSQRGSMLMEVLGLLYPDPTVATALFGGMKRIPGASEEIVNPFTISVVLSTQKERLLYLRLKLVHVSSPKSLISSLMEMAASGAAK